MNRITQVTAVGVALLAASALSFAHARSEMRDDDSPETILSTYHAKKGHDKELADALARTWQTYQNERAVFPQPHFLVRATDNQGNVDFTELFTWVSGEIPDHAPDSIKTRWNELQSLCEARNGHKGIEGDAVEILVPKQ
jgi:hypothetical protein